MSDYLYHYRAVVVSQYDGDTWTVDIDLGFGIWMKGQKLRLYGIDTPELRGGERPRGLIVRDMVRKWCPPGTELTIRTYRDRTGKYGRWLADILPDHWEITVNERLLEEGLAAPAPWD